MSQNTTEKEDTGCGYTGHEFGASYPDSICIDGYLWDADSGGPDLTGEYDWLYTNGGDIPCPKCNAEEYAEYVEQCRDEADAEARDEDGDDLEADEAMAFPEDDTAGPP